MEIDGASARRIEVMMSELVGLDGLQRATSLGIEAEMLGEGGGRQHRVREDGGRGAGEEGTRGQ